MIHVRKLTESSVLEARELYRCGHSLMGLGRRYNAHHTTIRSAVLGHTWKHVPGFADQARRPPKTTAAILRIAREIAREHA